MIYGNNKISIPFRGTIPYASPQMCAAVEFTPSKNDIWALGIIFTKTMPFATSKRAIKYVITANYHKPKKYDHKTIIERMLSVDEEQRPDISELFYLFRQYKTF